MLSWLKAIWQADGAFPGGGFAFSNGLEGVAALGGFDARALEALIAATLGRRWASFDRVAMLGAHRARGDLAALAALDAEVELSTFAEPLRAGSRRNGAAFLAAHARLGSTIAGRLRAEMRAGRCHGHVAVMQGAVWREAGLDEDAAALASGYAAAASLVTAAVRLGHVGALEGQRVLLAMLPLIGELAATPLPDDGALASFLPFPEIAAARHARAELRLFSN